MNDFYQAALDLSDFTISIRRDVHQNPELGFQESKTADLIQRHLIKAGCEVISGIAKTGVVGLIHGNSRGPVTIARFDMDALPIQEETGLSFSSKVPGVMHACGHDGHVAIGLTVAKILMKYRDRFTGTVKLVFQPAEEGQGGADLMVGEGILDHVDYALALHLWSELPTGVIGIRKGPVMAAADIFKIKIFGKGGHGAVPNFVVDPIVAASSVVSSIQSIVSRNLSPFDSGVVSITTIHGGDALNVIPSVVEMGGTIRTFDGDVRNRIIERLSELVSNGVLGYGCKSDLMIEPWTTAVVNDDFVTRVVQEAAVDMTPDVISTDQYQTMASEDMSAMLSRVPGCYFFIGSKNEALGSSYPHHHPKFNIDETAMIKAAGIMTSSLVRLNNYHEDSRN